MGLKKSFTKKIIINGLQMKMSKECKSIAGPDLIDSLDKSPWISVEDGLPCDHDELWEMTGGLIYTKKVLVVLADNTVKLMSMLYDEVNNKWKWDSILKNKIMFWMPIPKLPEIPKSVG